MVNSLLYGPPAQTGRSARSFCRNDRPERSARLSVPPDRTVAEVHWHEQPTIWVRVIDGFRNRIWRFSPNGARAQIDLPLSVESFDVSRDGVMAYAGGDFDHLPEIYIRAKNGSIRQLTHLQEGWGGIHLAPTTIFFSDRRVSTARRSSPR